MTVVKETPEEIEIVTDIMRDDQVRLTRLPNGEVELLIHNPQGGINGTAMTGGTVLTSAEVRAIKAWL